MSSGMNGTKSRGVFSSVEEMKAANLRVGVRVDVYGGDTYDIYATNQGSSIELDNGLWAEIVVTGGVTPSELTTAQNDIVGGSIFKGSNGEYVQSGDTVPVGTTHLRALVDGKPGIFAMSPVATGVISELTNRSATIGGIDAALHSKMWSKNELHILDFTPNNDGVTDDSDILQLALDTLNALGGGTLSIYGCNIALAKGVIIPSRVMLKGADFYTPRQNVNSGVGVSGGKPTGVITVRYGNGSTLQAESPIRLSTYTSVKNILFAYPDQVGTLTTPIQFPPTISPVSGTILYNVISGCTFHGASEWIRVDSGCGGLIELCSGALLPLGINVTNAISPTSIVRCQGAPMLGGSGSNLEDYTRRNGVLINIDYADGITIDDCKAINSRSLLTCHNSSHRPADSFGTREGAAWGVVTNSLADVCRFPIEIFDADNLQINGCELVGDSRYEFRRCDGVLIREIEFPGGTVGVNGTFFKNVSNGVKVRATGGNVSVSNPIARNYITSPSESSATIGGSGQLNSFIVTNEGNGATVNVDGVPFGKDGMGFLSGPMTVNGVKMHDIEGSTDITPSDLMDLSAWTSDAGMTQPSAGVFEFDINKTGISEVNYSFPSSIINTMGLFILEFEIDTESPDDLASDMQFDLSIRRSFSDKFSRLKPALYYPNFHEVKGAMHFVMPRNGTPTINIRFGRNTTDPAMAGTKVTLSNMKIHLVSAESATPSLIDMLWDSPRYASTSYGRFFGVDPLGRKYGLMAGVPLLTGYETYMDKIYNTSATAPGDIVYWIFNGTSWIPGAVIPTIP